MCMLKRKKCHLVCVYSTVEPRLSRLFDYPDFFLWSRFSWILNSCHLENTKLKIDQLNSFKRLLKQHIIFVLKCDEKFLKQTNMLYMSTYVCICIYIYLLFTIFTFSIIRTLDYPDYLPRSWWVWKIEVWLYNFSQIEKPLSELFQTRDTFLKWKKFCAVESLHSILQQSAKLPTCWSIIG